LSPKTLPKIHFHISTFSGDYIASNQWEAALFLYIDHGLVQGRRAGLKCSLVPKVSMVRMFIEVRSNGQSEQSDSESHRFPWHPEGAEDLGRLQQRQYLCPTTLAIAIQRTAGHGFKRFIHSPATRLDCLFVRAPGCAVNARG
jgi:hypothetical protein